jgi:hypothetical protein
MMSAEDIEVYHQMMITDLVTNDDNYSERTMKMHLSLFVEADSMQEYMNIYDLVTLKECNISTHSFENTPEQIFVQISLLDVKDIESGPATCHYVFAPIAIRDGRVAYA